MLHAEISVIDKELYFGISEKDFGRILCNNVSDCSNLNNQIFHPLSPPHSKFNRRTISVEDYCCAEGYSRRGLFLTLGVIAVDAGDC